MEHIKAFLIALVLMTTGAQAYDAYYVRKNENDAMAINQANISLAQATAIAEKYARGKAARVDYENDEHSRIYKIEILSYAKIFDVTIDADNGIVISSIESSPSDNES